MSGRIPALTDGNHNVFESGAVNQWLVEKYDKASRARALNILSAGRLTFAPSCSRPPIQHRKTSSGSKILKNAATLSLGSCSFRAGWPRCKAKPTTFSDTPRKRSLTGSSGTRTRPRGCTGQSLLHLHFCDTAHASRLGNEFS